MEKKGREGKKVGSSFEHPVVKLYSETASDVIERSFRRREIKNPFDWFVSALDLEDF